MNKLVLYLVVLVALTLLLILPEKIGYKADHPTLNKVAEEPDIHMRNVGRYMKAGEMERSIYHLQKAIESIRKIETDIDEGSIEGLDRAIAELEAVNDEFWEEEVDVAHMYKAFEYTLNNLAHAELEVSEMYAETNQEARSKLALRYAQMHIRNALLFQKNLYGSNPEHREVELHVFQELDSLIDSDALSSVALTMKIDHIIKEVDQLIVDAE